MNTTTLLLFATAASAVIVVPGPTTLLAMHNGSVGGMRLAVFGIAGAALSDALLIAAVGAGLGALLAASPAAVGVLKVAGALYLAWLAWQFWRSPPQAAAGATPVAPPVVAFGRSLMVALTNPKGWLFFAAFLLPFVDVRQSLPSQYILLGAIFCAIDIAVMSLYAVAGTLAARWSMRGQRLLLRGAALVLAALAVGLVFYRPAL